MLVLRQNGRWFEAYASSTVWFGYVPVWLGSHFTCLLLVLHMCCIINYNRRGDDGTNATSRWTNLYVILKTFHDREKKNNSEISG